MEKKKRPTKIEKSVAGSDLSQAKKGGKETWHVSSGGTSRTITTSKSSAMAMDRAVKKYSNALKRLADK